MNVTKNLWLLFLARFFGVGLLFTSVGILFMIEVGLSYTQIFVLGAIFALSGLVMEVPSGVFADRFGRKYSLLLSPLFMFLGTLIYCFGSSFEVFVIGQFFLGASMAFASGADTAYLYDLLLQCKRKKDFKRIYGNFHFVTFFSLGLFALLGGFVGSIDYRLTFVFTLIPVGLSFFILLFLDEPKQKKHIDVSYWKQVTESITVVKKRQSILFIIIFFMVAHGFLEGAWIMNQPYLKSIDFPEYGLGLLYAGFFLIAGFGAKFAHLIESYLGLKKTLLLIALSPALIYVVIPLKDGIHVAILLLWPQMIWGLLHITVDDFINKAISSQKRATILSLKNFSGTVSYTLLAPIIGLIIDTYSLVAGFLFIAACLFVNLFVLLHVFSRKRILRIFENN